MWTPKNKPRKTNERVHPAAAGAIENIAKSLERAATELRRLAIEVGQDEAINQVSEAVSIIQTLNGGLRLDQMINIPIEALNVRLLEVDSTPREKN